MEFSLKNSTITLSSEKKEILLTPETVVLDGLDIALPGEYEKSGCLMYAWRKNDEKLYHFRTRSGVEVDYVVEVNRELWGIEVKASEDVRSENLKGLRVLGDRAAGLKRKIVVFLGPRRMRQDDVEIIPLLEFLAELPS